MTKILSYLPLKKSHIIEIHGLSLSEIKKAAKNAHCDREKIGYNKTLNAIVKALGIAGGFARYQDEFNHSIVPFLRKHKLVRRKDLFSFRKNGLTTLRSLKRQDLSERIFYTQGDIPQRVFTGYDYDFKETLDDGWFYLNRIITDFSRNKKNEFGLLNTAYPELIDNIKANIALALGSQGNKLVPSQEEGYQDRKLIDIVLGGLVNYISYSFNVMSDTLFYPSQDSCCPEIFFRNDYDLDLRSKDLEVYTEAFRLFGKRISDSDQGWVELIPYNENLVFLKGRNSEYDFLFKNQRDKRFNHQIFSPMLERRMVPRFSEDYSFKRWYYFEYEGFRYKDQYNSETYFYESGGKASEYPGSDKVLLRYYLDKRLFSFASESSSCRQLKNFKLVDYLGKNMLISDVVSIRQFNNFLIENPDYEKSRKGDNLATVNNEDNDSLPVSVTWFDALAYIKWMQNKYGINFRLLNLDEYKYFRRQCSNIQMQSPPIDSFANNSTINAYYEHVEFLNNEGVVYNSHPPYMSPIDFDGLVFRFKTELPSITSGDGLRFIASNNYAEWLSEKTCIRSGNLKSFFNDEYIVRARPPLSCTGKYKGIKIGFRVCYEYLPDMTNN